MREFLQAAAVCLYGNLSLQLAESDRPPELLGRCSPFNNTYEIEFARSHSSAVGGHGPLAFGTSRWYRRLKTESVKEYSLVGVLPFRSPHPEGLWGIITEGNCGLELWRYSRHMRVRYDRDPTPCKAIFVSERFDRSQARSLPFELPTVGEYQETLDRTAASLRGAGLEVEGLYFSKLADQFGERIMPNTDYVDIVPPSIKGMGRLMLGLSIASLNAIYGFEAKVLECPEVVDASTQLWEASFSVLMNQANSVAQLKQAA